ncbi:MAG: glycosyltransferase [Muribaculum sp.]|nr:glycosyltransferase [Muribaculum sp.]
MKITFVTFHNWDTKRIGGFHKLAEGAVKAGHEVVFFSFSRPYFIYFKNEERLNKNILKDLSHGIQFDLGGQYPLVNCTWPTLRLPQPFHKYVHRNINRWLETHSFSSFNKFSRKFLKGTDIFVFESCDSILLWDKLKKRFPKSKFYYRPSDPLMVEGADVLLAKEEERIMRNADNNFIVNQAGLALYSSKIHNFSTEIKHTILRNGVDTVNYNYTYPKPCELNKSNTFLYVGARVIEWPLIIEAAKQKKDYNFIIVCPEIPPSYFLSSQLDNITYIPGIPPKDVAAWVTNADVIIVPNPQGLYNIKPWGITAKYFQAMEAKKPIVAFDDTDELKNFGVYVAHTYQDFIAMLDQSLKNKIINYNFIPKDWGKISEEFLQLISRNQ